MITENKITFLTLPMLPNTIGVWGSGFAVASLGYIPALKNARLWYRGDLDVQGFEILGSLRASVPETKARLMDRATWQKFQHHAVSGKEAPASPGLHLTAEETELYEELKNRDLRFAQERIPRAWASAQIQSTLS